ncbi:hypothetical protein [Streptomyces albicerus]|nr:hypothetical protein [Streptomyces albicerus]
MDDVGDLDDVGDMGDSELARGAEGMVWMRAWAAERPAIAGRR